MRFLARSRARLLGCALAFVVAALAGPGGASAATIFPSWSPDTLRGPAPYSVTYRFEFDTGALPEQIAFAIASEGAFAPQLTVDEGPVAITPIGTALASSIRSCDGGGSSAPARSGDAEWRLDLPPASRSIVSVVLAVPDSLPLELPRLNQLRFATATIPTDWKQGAPLDYHDLDVPGPALTVPRAAPFSLAIKSAPAGKPVPVIGRTSPQLAGKLIDLRYGYRRTTGYGPVPKTDTPLARVRVQSDGSFAYRQWRPARAGIYFVTAAYTSHDARFVSSQLTGCLPTLRVS